MNFTQIYKKTIEYEGCEYWVYLEEEHAKLFWALEMQGCFFDFKFAMTKSISHLRQNFSVKETQARLQLAIGDVISKFFDNQNYSKLYSGVFSALIPDIQGDDLDWIHEKGLNKRIFYLSLSLPKSSKVYFNEDDCVFRVIND